MSNVTLKLDGAVLEILQTYPHPKVWVDLTPEDGTITLSDENGNVFYKGITSVNYVPTAKREG